MNRVMWSVVALLTACGGSVSEVDDPEIESSGKQAASESMSLGEISEDAEDSEVTAKVQVIGSQFQAIQARHQASYAQGRGKSAPAVDPAGLFQSASEGDVQWDGERLQMNWSADSGGSSVDYVVDLRFSPSGDGVAINGTYTLAVDATVGGSGVTYDLNVSYNALTSDGSGCVVSGNLDLTYDYKVSAAGIDLPGAAGAGNLNGRVVVEFNGCDDVTVSVSQ